MKASTTLFLALTLSNHAAVVVSTFSPGGVDSDWSTLGNWNPLVVPNNTATDQYEVNIPASLAVELDVSTTLNSLAIAGASSLSVANSVTLTSGDITNNGLIELNGVSSFTRLFINDPSDNTVSLEGGGVLRLTGGSQNITGTSGHILTNGAAHTIEGFSPSNNIGRNTIDLVNEGTITANIMGGQLNIDPQTNFTNSGTVRVENEAILEFRSGTYSGAGTYQIGDGSLLRLNGVSLDAITLTGDDQNTDASDNQVSVTASSTVNDITIDSSVELGIENAITLTATGDITNNGLIELNGTSSFTRFFINNPSDNTISLEGSGVLRLTGDSQNITGTSGQILTNGAEHTIEGFNPFRSVGQNTINLINEGTISANVSGEQLNIDPQATFTNSGAVRVENEAILEFRPGTYSGAGTYQIGDGSLLKLNGLTLDSVTLTSDDQNADASDHQVSVTASSTVKDITIGSAVELSIDNGVTLTATGDVTNNGLIEFNGTNAFTRFFIDDPLDNAVTLGGSGILRFSDDSQSLSGPSGHVLTNGPAHTIEGSTPFRSIGLNLIDLINEGTISANVNGGQLNVAPANSLLNLGTLRAEAGAVLSLKAATYINEGFINIEPAGLVDFDFALFGADRFTQTDGELRVNGTLRIDDLLVEGGILSGSGVIEVETDNFNLANFSPASVLNPGDSTGTGTLTFTSGPGGSTSEVHQRNFNNATIEIDLLSDSAHDSIVFDPLATRGIVTGQANLRLNLVGSPSDFTGVPLVIMSGVREPTAGTFEEAPTNCSSCLAGDFPSFVFNNVAFGERIFTTDGRLSFIVNGGDSITLSDPIVTDPNAQTNAECVESLLTGAGGPFEGQTDPSIIGFDADPDGDGQGNVFELWFGTDPATSNPQPDYTISSINIDDNPFAALDVTVNSAIDDLLLVNGFFNVNLGAFSIGTRSTISEAGAQRNLRFLSPELINGERAFGRLQADPSSIKP